MIGVLLISHGNMASGIKNSLQMFFGNDIPQLDILCLKENSNVDEYGQELENKIQNLDKGEGVVIFTDLMGGTPCNQAIKYTSSKVILIAGMNLPIIMEFLGQRLSEENINNINFNNLLNIGKDALSRCELKVLEDNDEEL